MHNSAETNGRYLYFIFVDIFECVFSEYNNCHADAYCIDTIGSYACRCKDGYNGDGFTCTSMYLKSFILNLYRCMCLYIACFHMSFNLEIPFIETIISCFDNHYHIFHYRQKWVSKQYG